MAPNRADTVLPLVGLLQSVPRQVVRHERLRCRSASSLPSRRIDVARTLTFRAPGPSGGALVGEYAPRSVESSPTKHAPVSPPTAPSARPVAAAPPPAVPTRPLFASPAPPRPTPPPPVAPAPAARGPSPVPSSAAPAPSAPAAPVAPASSLLARPAPPPKPASIVSRAGAAASTPSTDGDSADASSAQPHKVATPAFDDDDQRGPLTSSTPGRSSLTSPSALADSLSSLSIPTRSRTSLTSAPPSLSNLPSLCPSCSKPVYHAERVTALSRAWHRACLRCSGCGTGLGNQPGRIEEKEGSPWCRRCYQERWGITGGMGMTTVRGLLLFLSLFVSGRRLTGWRARLQRPGLY